MSKKPYCMGLTTCLTLFAITMTMLEGTGVAWAWRSPPPRYWSGPRFRELPRDYRMVRHGRNSYYFSYGRFYRRGPTGYYLALPPIGMIVPILPFGFASLVIGGLTYYELNGIYYRQVPEGYRVVEYPLEAERSVATPAVDDEQRVVVQSELLNVRTGPGLEQDAITQVNRGKVLKVRGNVPGWYYVELDDGEHGWVMEKFVVPLKPVPEG